MKQNHKFTIYKPHKKTDIIEKWTELFDSYEINWIVNQENKYYKKSISDNYFPSQRKRLTS